VHILNNSIITILDKQLDALTLRQRVIANNVANANTPGFKKSEVAFSNQLRDAMDKNGIHLRYSHPKHITTRRSVSEIEAKVVTTENTIMNYGKNNVDVEQEMVNLAANTIMYNAVSRMISGKLTSMGNVIKGGR